MDNSNLNPLKIINEEVFTAFLECRLKAYNISKGVDGKYNEYNELYVSRAKSVKNDFIKRKKYGQDHKISFSKSVFEKNLDCIIDLELVFKNLIGHIDLLIRSNLSSDSTVNSYLPFLFSATNKINKNLKLQLAFNAYIFRKLTEETVSIGKIICPDQTATTVKLIPLFKEVEAFLKTIKNKIIKRKNFPQVIINRHCQFCQFQQRCERKAQNSDHISLLDHISSFAQIEKYRRKGIFTVNQLSYLYRPRKQRKRSRKSLAPRHSVELQALVIRLKKIFVQESPSLNRTSTELFIDFESIPDQDFYYLIGVIVQIKEDNTYYDFWSDSINDEGNTFQNFIKLLDKHADASIYHYGSLEQKALVKLGKRHGVDVSKYDDRLININSHIYGKVYFPVRSNSLKEIGKFIGTSWIYPNATGLKSIVWRMNWERKCKRELKNRIIQYNKDDCLALLQLTDFLSAINQSNQTIKDVDCFIFSKKSHSSKARNPLHQKLELLLKFGHANYNKNKITFRDINGAHSNLQRNNRTLGRSPKNRKVTKCLNIPDETKCPYCWSHRLKEKSSGERVEVDLDFNMHGVRKQVIKYSFHSMICKDCKKSFIPKKFRVPGRPRVYGYGFKVWITYQRIFLKQSYGNIDLITKDLFDEKFSGKAMIIFLNKMGKKYSYAEKKIWSKLTKSSFLHVDDTQVNIDHINKYVWVFTNGKHVLYLKTESREANFLQNLLSDFSGVLVTDFFAGFDKLSCKHQKCLAHVIRDLNNDLWTSQFDNEFVKFVNAFSKLIMPIMNCINKYGMQHKYLSKFEGRIEKFNKERVINKQYKSNNCLKYQKRFKKYWDSLFTFIHFDGVPWHNNVAENALRQITAQQDISRRFSNSTIKSYLALLSIKQTCTFQNKSFLNFLLSDGNNEKNTDIF